MSQRFSGADVWGRSSPAALTTPGSRSLSAPELSFHSQPSTYHDGGIPSTAPNSSHLQPQARLFVHNPQPLDSQTRQTLSGHGSHSVQYDAGPRRAKSQYGTHFQYANAGHHQLQPYYLPQYQQSQHLYQQNILALPLDAIRDATDGQRSPNGDTAQPGLQANPVHAASPLEQQQPLVVPSSTEIRSAGDLKTQAQPKRKRGRPPKPKELTPAQNTQPKKRGRPPKPKEPASDSSQNAQPKKRGRPPKAQEEPQSTSKPDSESLMTKGKKRAASEPDDLSHIGAELHARKRQRQAERDKGKRKEIEVEPQSTRSFSSYPPVPNQPIASSSSAPKIKMPEVGLWQAFSERINGLPESHARVVRFFVNGGKTEYLTFSSEVNCTRIDGRDCHCQHCMVRFLFFWASLIVHHDIYLDECSKGIDMVTEKIFCPLTLELVLYPQNYDTNADGPIHIQLLHISNLASELQRNNGFSGNFSIANNCFVRDELTGGRYWWRNGLEIPPEMWPKIQLPNSGLKDRFIMIECPKELAALWIVSESKIAWQVGYFIEMSIEEYIRVRQGEVLSTFQVPQSVHSDSPSESISSSHQSSEMAEQVDWQQLAQMPYFDSLLDGEFCLPSTVSPSDLSTSSALS